MAMGWLMLWMRQAILRPTAAICIFRRLLNNRANQSPKRQGARWLPAVLFLLIGQSGRSATQPQRFRGRALGSGKSIGGEEHWRGRALWSPIRADVNR